MKIRSPKFLIALVFTVGVVLTNPFPDLVPNSHEEDSPPFFGECINEEVVKSC